ncbi:MAG: Y4bD/Y4pK family protein [marine benthic group bacterium]|nr:Y4bD/Y4pK family protein [Gemmatimonadota bacterium]
MSHWRNWGDDRVVYEDPQGRVRSLPTAWTSLAGADPFVRASAGRSYFRTEDLVALVSLIGRLTRSEACKADFAESVKETMPQESRDVRL